LNLLSRYKNVTLYFLGNILNKASLFISGILIANLLKSELFGVFTLSKSTILSGALILLFGLPNELIREISNDLKNSRYDLNKKISSIIIYQLAFTVSFFILSPFIFGTINKFIFSNVLTVTNYFFILLFLYFYVSSILINSILCGFGYFDWIGLSNIIVSTITIPLIYFFTKTLGLNGSLIGFSLVYLFLFLFYSYKFFKIEFKFQYRFKFIQYISDLLNKSKNILFHELSYTISSIFFLTILSKKINFSGLGIFNAGEQLAQMILFIPTSGLGYFLSKYVNYTGTNSNRFKKQYLTFSLTFVIVLSIIFLLLIDFIVEIYGETFLSLKFILIYFFVALIPQMYNSIQQQILIAENRSKDLLKISLITAGALIIGSIWLYNLEALSVLYFVLLKLLIFVLNFLMLISR